MAVNQPTDFIPNEKDNNSEIRSITTPQTSSDVEASITNEAVVEHSIKRGLKPRHMQLISLGGTIGTGLFVSSGKTLAEGGPCFLLVCYAILSALIYLLVVALTEITTYLPVRGGTVSYYGSRYVSKSFGFMLGYLYVYTFAIFVPFELTAAALVIEYWGTNLSSAIFITVFLVTIVILNLLPVKYYGEAEFWFASLKIILIMGLLLLSFILFWGGGPSRDRLGFRYWRDPGAVNTLFYGGDLGRFCSFIATIVTCVLPFAFAPEMLVITAGEVQSPRTNLPKTARRFFWRLIVFYIGSVVAIGVICPSNSPLLTSGGAGAGSSPWVVGIKQAGISGLDGVVNAVIITAAWSAGNSFLYLASRSLYSLAITGDAPAVFGRCNKHGTPYVAVGTCSLFSLLAYMTINSTANTVFNWMVNLVNTGGFISWICCSIIYIRFRKAIEAQNLAHTTPFHSRLAPIGTWITLTVFLMLCLLNGFTVFFPGQWSVSDFLSAYIGLPIFIVVYLVHRAVYWNDLWVHKVEDIDLVTGLDVAEADEKPAEVPTTYWGKTMAYIL